MNMIPHRFDFYFGRIDFNDPNVTGGNNPSGVTLANEMRHNVNLAAKYIEDNNLESLVHTHNRNADDLAKEIAKAFDMTRFPHCLKYDFGDFCAHAGCHAMDDYEDDDE